MKTRYFVSFSVPRAEGEDFRRLMETIGCIDIWEEPHNERALPHLYHTFDSDDPRLAQLRGIKEREAHRINYWSERVEHVYSKRELRSFPLLGLSMGGKPILGATPLHGTEYDLSTGCRACGTGAKQVSPLMLPLGELPKKRPVCQTNSGHPLVGPKIAESLRQAGISGLELRQIQFYRNNEPLPWWQMIASLMLPPMSARTTSITRDIESGWACSICNRDMHCGRTTDDSPIVYDSYSVRVQDLPDVVHSWECFGRSVLKDDPQKGLSRNIAQPAMLVKPKVLDLFEALKIKGVCFSPVRIE